MVKYKKFKIGDLFEKKTVKGYPKKEENLTPNKNGFHTFGQNIKYQHPQKILMDSKYRFTVDKDKPILAYTSSTGSIGLIEESFYRSGDNGAFQALLPRFSNYSHRHLLYLLTVINKIFDELNYNTSISNVPDMEILLPVTVLEEPDWNYMENYIIQLEADRLQQLEAYLIATGLNDYVLTDKDKETLSLSQINISDEVRHSKNVVEDGQVRFKKFMIVDIFEVKNSHNILKSSVTFGSGKYPYVTAQKGNNSIASYIDYSKEFLEKGNCIFIGGKTLVINYQEQDFFSNDSHNLLLYLKEKQYMTKKVQLYLVSALYKSLKPKYYWGNSISSKKIQDDIIALPVDKNEEINFEYMENYIGAIEKLTIKDVVDYKDKVMALTKEVM